jgi:hypothetical protein
MATYRVKRFSAVLEEREFGLNLGKAVSGIKKAAQDSVKRYKRGKLDDKLWKMVEKPKNLQQKITAKGYNEAQGSERIIPSHIKKIKGWTGRNQEGISDLAGLRV